jgi:hypothetical protein
VLYVICALVWALVVAASTTAARRSAAEPAGAVVAAPAVPVAWAAAAAPSATELSLQLQSLLGQHTVLAADMMRGRVRGDPDLAQAANAALGKNTDAMGQIVGTMFGDAAKNQFTTMWASHVQAFFNYARGLADKDAAVRSQAEATIAKFESDLAAFFSAAAQGRLPTATAQAVIKEHVDHLLHQADEYAAGDYAQADKTYRQAYSQAFGIGKALASTLLPPDVAARLNTPTWRLRSELDRLLGEHVVLVIAAMRAGVTNAPDFAAAASTVNGNTRDLAGAVETLFGQAAGQRFQSLWADHVDALIRYAGGLVKQNATQRSAAKTELSGFERDFAAFLGTATRNRISTAALAKAFLMHDQMLIGEVEAFVAKDYRKAHDLAYSTYQDMFGLAGQLSNAFGATVASRLPVGAVQTGRGGMAAVVARREHGG